MPTDILKLRHSAAHLLAMAVVSLYKDAKIGACGVTETGFYYDINFSEPLSSDELVEIEQKMQELSEANLSMTSISRSREEVIGYYVQQEQPFKRETVEESKLKKIDLIAIGDNQFVDICPNGVVPATSYVKHFNLTDVSGAYWKGDELRPMLTRITGVCFDSEAELQAYNEFQEELAKRDHRVLGKKLGYFAVDPDWGTGLVFWASRGKYAKEALENELKAQYRGLMADLVESPLLFTAEEVKVVDQPQQEQLVAKNLAEEDAKWLALRQQYLSSHLRMFSWKSRSYRDLPWRVAEIGKLIRYEKAGELDGLARSREFVQDSLTIVCLREQIEREFELLLQKSLLFLRGLGLSDFEIQLKTPEASTKSQKQDAVMLSGLVKNVARKLSVSIQEEVGEVHIHEPELTITVKDSLRQKHQLTKIQILFSAPIEFGITYTGKDGEEHAPVVIRSTFTGSIERLIAVLIEHFAGALPLWLTQEHCRIIPVTDKQQLYAEKVLKALRDAGINGTLDEESEPIEGKIKQAEEDKVPYMLIVGEKEQSTNAISVRMQGKGDIGLLDVDTFIREIQVELNNKSIKSTLL